MEATIQSNAQSSFSLSTGLSTDLNNSQSLNQIPVSLIWKPFKDKRMPLFLELDYAFPLGSKSSGEAYTLNPALPEKVILTEKISPYIFTVSVGFSIHLFTTKKGNIFYLNVAPVAVCNQTINATYKDYDKANYEVMNPDVNSKESGFVMSMAPVYYFHKGKQCMLLMLHLQTPLLIGKRNYPLSYRYMAPMQLTFGYNFYYNK
jgi:hypothetical protein